MLKFHGDEFNGEGYRATQEKKKNNKKEEETIQEQKVFEKSFKNLTRAS
jgi:hypothetical protein